MYPHTIQLREPWQQSVAGNAPVLTRRFNSPTGLESREAVWLIIERPSRETAVEFNGELLGAILAEASGEFEITRQLKPSNEIQLRFTASEEPPKFAGVRLEIRLKS